MATGKTCAAIVIAVLCFLSSSEASTMFMSMNESKGCFSAIYSFGDSLADTGNLLISNPLMTNTIGCLPYGETFFHRPTGRCSDGRLVLDFMAEASGMPTIEPYLKNFSSNTEGGGVNFAVAGATALDTTLLASHGVSPVTPYSLGVQIQWFLAYKADFCSKFEGDCDKHFGKALFMMGEIGGNDYNYQFFANTSIDQVEKSIFPVVAEIEKALRTLIEEGAAKKIMIQNNLPIGCSPAYLTMNMKEPRNAMACMPRFNAFAHRGNEVLRKMVMKLQNEYKGHGVVIVQADYFGAAMEILAQPKRFGFHATVKACCGVKEMPYGFHPTELCAASPNATACPNPWQYFNWDGIHLTESAYRSITSLFLTSYTSPSFSMTLCPFASLFRYSPPSI